VFLFLPAAHAQDLPAARTFVQQLYAAYDHAATPSDPDVLDKLAPSIFSPSLLHLIRHDQQINHGQAPALDWDPICDCQDSEGMHLTALTVTSEGASHSSARATLKFGNTTKVVSLSLVLTPKGWRIDDIASTEVPSIRKYLHDAR
jgi:hypothetical protein